MRRALRKLFCLSAAIVVSGCVATGSVQTSAASTTEPEATPYPLVATDATLTEQCREAARLLGFSVPCPTALPETNNPVRCEIPGAFRDAVVEPKEGCALGGGFLLQPTGIKDLDLFHVIIAGAPDEFFGCGIDQPHREVMIGERDGLLIACNEPGLHEGHTMARFEESGIYVEVSAHGQNDLQERAVLAIAEAIDMVPS